MKTWIDQLSARLSGHARHRGRGRALGVGLLMILLAGLAGLGLGSMEKNQAEGRGTGEHRVLTAKTRAVQQEDGYERHRRFLGRVEAYRSSRVGFELSGAIRRVNAREGEKVAEGQELAALDTRRLRAALSEARAGLMEAEAALELARTTLSRSERAREMDAISAQQLDEARRNFEVQQARVARVEAQVERIEVDLDKSVLRAPFSGTVARRFLDEGAVAGTGQPVLEIMETDRPEIRVGIDRGVANGLEAGSRLEANLGGESFRVKILRILPGRDPSTRTVQVIATPASPGGPALREGDLVDILTVETVAEPGFWLPVPALTENARGLWSCYVAEPLEDGPTPSGATHRLTRRELEVLAMEDDRVFVAGSLESGERVLVEGIHRIVPDQRIQLAGTAVPDTRLTSMLIP